jgi:predicted alpha/beta hydrolase family esterase
VKKPLFVVPRWSGDSTSDWYPWLGRRLAEMPEVAFIPEVVPLHPDPDEPAIEECVGALRRAVGTGSQAARRTILVGHSVGCQVILRYLATLPERGVFTGILCVAGWWTVDEPWASIRPWVETPIDPARARAALDRIVVLLSDNDPYTADFAANWKIWKEKPGAEVHLFSGAGHFNRAEEPAVLDSLAECFGVR